MIIVNITYYENELKRKLEPGTPWRRTVHGIQFPYLPRPGDRLFIEDRVDSNGGVVNLNEIEVKFVEMIDGEESVYVHATDPGYEPYGSLSRESRKEMEEFASTFR